MLPELTNTWPYLNKTKPEVQHFRVIRYLLTNHVLVVRIQVRKKSHGEVPVGTAQAAIWHLEQLWPEVEKIKSGVEKVLLGGPAQRTLKAHASLSVGLCVDVFLLRKFNFLLRPLPQQRIYSLILIGIVHAKVQPSVLKVHGWKHQPTAEIPWYATHWGLKMYSNTSPPTLLSSFWYCGIFFSIWDSSFMVVWKTQLREAPCFRCDELLLLASLSVLFWS